MCAGQPSREQAPSRTCCSEMGVLMGTVSGLPSSVCRCTAVPHSASTSGTLHMGRTHVGGFEHQSEVQKQAQ